MFSTRRTRPRCDCGAVLRGRSPKCARCRRASVNADPRPIVRLELQTRFGLVRCLQRA